MKRLRPLLAAAAAACLLPLAARAELPRGSLSFVVPTATVAPDEVIDVAMRLQLDADSAPLVFSSDPLAGFDAADLPTQGNWFDPVTGVPELRDFASIIKGKKKADGVRLMVVPGSARVRLEAEAEGIDKIVEEFGCEWRFAGCSMCLGMNPDQLAPGERCASTSNRNFEGRQGKGGRTHLVSPLVAAATAIRGTLSSPWDLQHDAQQGINHDAEKVEA